LHGKAIFITGLHNKPQGCGASVASPAGPYTTKKFQIYRIYRLKLHIRLIFTTKENCINQSSCVIPVFLQWGVTILEHVAFMK
jgi:hypothetical protein